MCFAWFVHVFHSFTMISWKLNIFYYLSWCLHAPCFPMILQCVAIVFPYVPSFFLFKISHVRRLILFWFWHDCQTDPSSTTAFLVLAMRGSCAVHARHKQERSEAATRLIRSGHRQNVALCRHIIFCVRLVRSACSLRCQSRFASCCTCGVFFAMLPAPVVRPGRFLITMAPKV